MDLGCTGVGRAACAEGVENVGTGFMVMVPPGDAASRLLRGRGAETALLAEAADAESLAPDVRAAARVGRAPGRCPRLPGASWSRLRGAALAEEVGAGVREADVLVGAGRARRVAEGGLRGGVVA